MKQLLIFFISISLNAQTGFLGFNDNTIPIDKQDHITAGLASGTVSYTLAYNWTKGDRIKAVKISLGMTAVLGTIKELTDIPTTGFDRDDLFSTIIGGVISTLATDMIMSKYTYKQRQKMKLDRIKRRDKAREEHLVIKRN